MHIQVRINEDGALRNQRYAFTDKFTLISELMQNARRAGATRIDIAYDEESRILRVVDDGCGIEDFQKLLTFNESGWDQDTCDEERPFGIGFSKCLYSASRCVVTSGTRKIDFLTVDALGRQPVDVVDVADVDYQPHTAIELHDVNLPGLAQHLETMCSGFPLPVWFNGAELARMHAIDHLPFVPAEIGQVYLAGTEDGSYQAATLVFLQGFCVLRPVWYQPAQVNVVHLDSRQFVARLPDRDKLIDEADQSRRINRCLTSLWRQVLLDTHANMEDAAFIEMFFEAMRHWGYLDLLNAIALLPRCLCKRIAGYPIQQEFESSDYLGAVEQCPTRDAIESGRIVLVDLADVNDDNTVHWMFARARGYIVVSAAALHRDHWAQPYLRGLEEETSVIEVIGEQCRATLEGRWIWPEVVLCDAVALTVGGECVELTDAGVYCGGTLFIPSGEHSGEPVRQVSNFVDDNEWFQEDHCDADRDALHDLLRRLRSVDPVATLDSLLRELNLEKYPLLQGKAFRLTVGDGRREHTVELTD